MSKWRIGATLLVVAAGWIFSGSTARANDFYLRVGGSLEAAEETRFKDKSCSSTSPAALYGCGTGNDGAPKSTLGDFGAMAGFELGVGRSVTPVLRLEAVLQHRPSFTFKGRANFVQTTARQTVAADLSSLSGMIAAYVDLPRLGLSRFGPFNPFIGGGAGVSRIHIGETRMEFPKTATIVPGGQRAGFARMLTAGVGIELTETVTLDLGYRYRNSGTAEIGRATGRIVWHDGSREPLELGLAETRATVSGQGFQVSLRYRF
ncbi:MAG: outer membrane beta-barrel protein [Acidobacteria bacterium]|nr:outer membrane beta-barrel protein [Acidobacteriota bacterium]